jgi:hypothetical protein
MVLGRDASNPPQGYTEYRYDFQFTNVLRDDLHLNQASSITILTRKNIVRHESRINTTIKL